MDENSALIEKILREQEEEDRAARPVQNDVVYPWQTVSHQKRSRKPSKPSPDAALGAGDGRPNGGAEVFRSVELRSEGRPRRAAEAQVAAASKPHSDDEGDSGEEVAVAVENGGAEAKKAKQKKPKRVKVTVAEAASKIDAGDLGAFLADISVSENLDNSEFSDPIGFDI